MTTTFEIVHDRTTALRLRIEHLVTTYCAEDDVTGWEAIAALEFVKQKFVTQLTPTPRTTSKKRV